MILRWINKTRIGIDIDGVLTDIEQCQIDYESKFYFEKYHRKI